MTDTGATAAGSFTVTENATETYTDAKTGNSTKGNYTDARVETDVYSMTENGSDSPGDSFTLNLSGTNSFQVSENGNSVLATYARTTNGTDTYAMSETGLNGGKKFSQSITATGVYKVQELGNGKTGTFSRIESGADTYDLKESGAISKPKPKNHGTLTYSDTETGNTRAGSFALTKGGADRFSLLEFFIDVSNTGNGYAPGNMDFHPAGLPFVDPDAEDLARAISLTGPVGQLIFLFQSTSQKQKTLASSAKVAGEVSDYTRGGVNVLTGTAEFTEESAKRVWDVVTGDKTSKLAQDLYAGRITDEEFYAETAKSMATLGTKDEVEAFLQYCNGEITADEASKRIGSAGMMQLLMAYSARNSPALNQTPRQALQNLRNIMRARTPVPEIAALESDVGAVQEGYSVGGDFGETTAEVMRGAESRLRPPRLGKNWRAREVTDPACQNGCENVAKQIQGHIGGEIVRITPSDPQAAGLGAYRGHVAGEYGWAYHEVVVKDGRVYDAFTGHKGLPIAEYQALWENADAINFGF